MANVDEIAAPTSDVPLQLSENAAKRISFLMQQEDEGDGMVRVSVSGGGCAGFQYGFAFDHTLNDDDIVIERDGAKIVVDSLSIGFLQGSMIDYVEDMIGASFAVTNPNATSSCSCGSSFAV